jgi:hypothetical protein
MSMHLVGPHLTTTRYNSKKKVANTQKLRDAREAHDRFLERMGVGKSKLPTDRKGRRVGLYDIPDYQVKSAIPLSNTVAGSGAKITEKRYTGTLIKGIATMHKSNAVPILNKEQAIEVSTMRRG